MKTSPFQSIHQRPIWLALAGASVLLVLGIWWIILLGHLKGHDPKLSRMLFWEGGSFLLLLALVFISVLTIHHREQAKNKSLQSFFASLTHELKTPLASIRLQAEVLLEDPTSAEKVSRYGKRLVEGVHKLEHLMDQFLQYSRLEKGATIALVPVSLTEVIKEANQPYQLHLSTNILDHHTVMGDPFLLKLVFKNLFENTLIHALKKEATLSINARHHDEEYELVYSDGGLLHDIDAHHLGELFYKGPRSKGSGIGLYLLGQIAKACKGTFHIKHSPHLTFHLVLKKSEEEAHD